MKKMMALMLAFVMVTTCMISTAFAAEPTPEVSVSFEASAIIADSDVIDAGKQNNQTTTSNFPCNFNFAVSNMNRFNQGIYHG